MDQSNMSRRTITGFRSLGWAVGLAVFVVLGYEDVGAQVFRSGSDGSYGPIVVTNGTTLTIPLPPSGVLNCTTVRIGVGGTLRFAPNAMNTPVYLLATGDVVFENNGRIVVSGEDGRPGSGGAGGPGGFAGGEPGDLASMPGDGLGPGRGRGGRGGPATAGGAGSAAYGNPVIPGSGGSTNHGGPYGNRSLIPLVGGSGGGGGIDTTGQSPAYGGGGGGGALLIASDTRIDAGNQGAILAGGGAGSIGTPASGGNGSGGAVRLVAPFVAVYSIETFGSSFAGGGKSGEGRIRIDRLPGGGSGPAFFSGALSVGSQMIGMPTNLPSLRIVEVAGRSIPETAAGVVEVNLGPTASSNQIVRLQARNFVGGALLELVVSSESGPSTTHQVAIDMDGASVVTTNLEVTLPINIPTLLQAWGR